MQVLAALVLCLYPHQVVGAFLIEENSESIVEALSVLKKYNTSRKPMGWMLNNCTAERKAVESTLPDLIFASVEQTYSISTHFYMYM